MSDWYLYLIRCRDDTLYTGISTDGDLDAFAANAGPNPNKVWLNDGSGNFINSGWALGDSNTFGVALGDLDAFAGNSDVNKVWVNQLIP